MKQYLMNQRIAAAEANKLKKKKSVDGITGDDDDDDDDESSDDEKTDEVNPTRPEHWNSLGSEAEVDEGIWAPQRPKIQIQLTRRRRLFGAPVSFSHTVSVHQELDEDVTDGDTKRKSDSGGDADEGMQTIVTDMDKLYG